MRKFGNVNNMLELEDKIHGCRKCKQEHALSKILEYYPVYSFGNPSGKEIMVVGQNPSTTEYKEKFLSNDRSIARRRRSQLTYFERRSYAFFDEIGKFFEGEVKKRLNWTDSPWEKVGYIDLVKCATRCSKGQWSKIGAARQRLLIKNCEHYLKEQLGFYKPKIILAYGARVSKWLAEYLHVRYEGFEDRRAVLNDKDVHLLFVPQRQGPHSKPEVFWIKKKILNMIDREGTKPNEAPAQ